MVDNYELALKIRNGLFLAASRTYGEQYVEPFIRHMYGLTDPPGNDHDGVGSDGIRYEIKASKVLKKTTNISKSKKIIDRVLFENDNAQINRLLPFSAAKELKYDANIQNVKRDHFEELIYVLLFEDCLKVFQIKAEEISAIPRWSDKHGRYDALGKSGQFMINKSSIEWHLKNQLKDTFSYTQVADAYQKIS
ncbi:hypothetical protein MCEMRE191_00504 [Candidatus Nanopelagicaceae bacterium]